jgi:transcriptional regulator with XRE-family HTH domain
MMWWGEAMPSKKPKIEHAEVVKRFAARLRELRSTRGLTQVELAERSHVTVSHIRKLEAAGAAPGLDLLERLATALSTTIPDLVPATSPPDTDEALRAEAKRLAEMLIKAADRETLLMLNPLLVRLIEASR